MDAVSITSLAVGALVCLYASISDIRTGRISNRVLLVALAASLALCAVRFGVLRAQGVDAFAINVLLVGAISLVLFCTQTWAGGDCKLAFVLALLYPPDAYLQVGNFTLSLPLAIALAFVLGVVYLLASFLFDVARGRARVSAVSTRLQFLAFVQSYVCALSCIGVLYVLNHLFIGPHVAISPVAVGAVGFCCIWLLSSFGLLKSRILLAVTLTFDLVAAVALQVWPLGGSPVRYLLVLVVVLTRILVSSQNYKTIPTCEVQEGMILSTASSLAFASSRVKGLPGVSDEGLESQLTQEEAESVKRWGATPKGLKELDIVRKIPFGVFVSLGYIAYFALWGVAL